MDPISRRKLLIGSGALVGLAVVSTATAAADPLPPLDDRLAELERRSDRSIGVYAVDARSGRTVAYRADDTLAVCSTAKVYASARVLQKYERGELRLTDTVVIEASDVVSNSPVTETRVGRTMTLAELCTAALQVSDNTAMNELLRVIGGPPAVTEFARSIGDDVTRLDRFEPELNTAILGDPRDTSTPRALGAGFDRLLTGEVLAPAQRDQLVRWMRDNQTSSMRAGLPPGWTSADKTGSGDYGSTNDVGMIYGPDGQRAVLSIMTRSQTDDPKADNDRSLIGEVTALVLPYLSPEN